MHRASERVRPPHRLLSSFTVTVVLALSTLSAMTAYLPLAGLGAPDTWTFMVYLNGDNDLEQYGIDDFLEMSSVGSSADVNIVVQFDRIIGYNWDYGAWNTAKRFHVTQGMTPTAANATMDLGEVNMGSPTTLTDFIDWTVSTYDTMHYVLVVWDHGGSWSGVSWDYTYVGPGPFYMDMGALDTALADAVALNAGLMLDVIAFDACTMGTLEVAYQVMPYARYMVASEMSVPDPGFEYGGPLSALVSNPAMSVTAFSDEILGHFASYYLSLEGTPDWYFLNGSFSLSVIDLQLVADLAASVNLLSTELLPNMDSWVNHVKVARNATEDYFGASEDDSPDLHHLAQNLAAVIPNATLDLYAADIMAGVEAAVLNETHGTNPLNSTVPVNHTNGLSIYFQSPVGWYDASYASTGVGFASATTWDEMLALYDGEWRLGYPTVMDFGPTGIDVPLDTPVEIWFSEPVNNSSFFEAFSISPAPSGPAGPVYTNSTYYIIPLGLDPGTTYTVSVSVNLTDGDGVHMVRNFTWTFTTEPAAIPEFPSALHPIIVILGIVLAVASRRRPGKAFRK